MSRLDKLKEQHPELNISVIDLLAKVDPTDSYKYTEFLVKKIKEWYGGDSTDKTHIAMGIELIGDKNIKALNEFEIHSKAGRIKKNDIGQHKNFNSLSESVREADEILKQKEAEKQVIKLMDTDEYCIVVPLSYEASKIYGAGTKWCTTQERYWSDYVGNYKLIYIINKITNKKYAISRKINDNTEIKAWLDNDEETSPFLLPLSSEVMVIITNEIRKNETIKDLTTTKEVKVIKRNKGAVDAMGLLNKYLLYGAPNGYGVGELVKSMGDIYQSLDEYNIYNSNETGDGYDGYDDDEESEMTYYEE